MGLLGVAMVMHLLVAVVIRAPRDVEVELVRLEGEEMEARVTWGEPRQIMLIDAKQDRLSIQSSANEGELLLMGEKIDQTGSFYTALDQSFFTTETQLSNGKTRTTEYTIPESLQSEAKEAFHQRKIDRMLARFEQVETRLSSERLIGQLVQRPEVMVLERAVTVLGERGVIGAENKGALLFYMTVLNLVKGRDRGEGGEQGGRQEQSTNPMTYRAGTVRQQEREKRATTECPHIVQPLPSQCSAVETTKTSERWLIRPILRTTDTEIRTTTDCPCPTSTVINPPTDETDRDQPEIDPCRVVLSYTTQTSNRWLWGPTTWTLTHTSTVCNPSPTPTCTREITPSCPTPTSKPPGPQPTPIPDPCSVVLSYETRTKGRGRRDARPTTWTETHTSTICSKPTIAPTPTSEVVPTSTPEATPCCPNLLDNIDPASNNIEDYYPYSSDQCAPEIPNNYYICSDDCTRLCEDCHHGYECKRNRCPEVKNCVGMCGRNCTCWPIICGDCCHYEGCYTHDLYCDNFYSLECLIPFGFSCNGYWFEW